MFIKAVKHPGEERSKGHDMGREAGWGKEMEEKTMMWKERVIMGEWKRKNGGRRKMILSGVGIQTWLRIETQVSNQDCGSHQVISKEDGGAQQMRGEDGQQHRKSGRITDREVQ